MQQLQPAGVELQRGADGSGAERRQPIAVEIKLRHSVVVGARAHNRRRAGVCYGVGAKVQDVQAHERRQGTRQSLRSAARDALRHMHGEAQLARQSRKPAQPFDDHLVSRLELLGGRGPGGKHDADTEGG